MNRAGKKVVINFLEIGWREIVFEIFCPQSHFLGDCIQTMSFSLQMLLNPQEPPMVGSIHNLSSDPMPCTYDPDIYKHCMDLVYVECMRADDLFDGYHKGIIRAWEEGRKIPSVRRQNYTGPMWLDACIHKAIKDGYDLAYRHKTQQGQLVHYHMPRRSKRKSRAPRRFDIYAPGWQSQLEREVRGIRIPTASNVSTRRVKKPRSQPIEKVPENWKGVEAADGEEICSVCLTNRVDTISRTCPHAFCIECCYHLRERHLQCPHCRADMKGFIFDLSKM